MGRMEELSPDQYFGDTGCADVADLHRKFGFTLNLKPTRLLPEVMNQRADFIAEEVKELRDAIARGDFPATIDALIDIVYVAKGTAVMMGIDWDSHWMEVHIANMAKVRGKNPARPDQEEDLIKPEGWTGPDHDKVLRSYEGE